MKQYTALIRTFNSAATLPSTIGCLMKQTRPPSGFVFVDSGSTDATLSLIPPNSVVHNFCGEFNYAEALNQGLHYINTPYVLIVSSHTTLSNHKAIDYGLKLLEANDAVGASYFCWENSGELSHTLINRESFTGFNGLFNTCGLVRVDLLRERSFRREVFTAEDQEWARWLLVTKGGLTARISGAGFSYNNPKGNPIRKRLNEYLSVAYNVKPELFRISNIVRVGLNAVKPGLRRGISLSDRSYYLRLSAELLKCRFRRPKLKARYF
jgi:glycosyltransferase involved in cell wall biosynthesis